MSASDKKKLRKELNAAAVTEKQQTEMKAQKKARTYSIIFVVSMILVVALVLVSVLQTPVTVLMGNNTVAATVNDHQISAAEFNYFYYDVISNFYGQFSNMGTYQDMYVQLYTGLNPTKPLNEQKYGTDGKTWADHFISSALDSVKWTYSIYDKAVAAGHKLSEDEQKSLDNLGKNMEMFAKLYGFSNVDGYLRSQYGASATLDSYLKYYEVSMIASSYATAHHDSLKFDGTAIRDFEKEKMEEFNSYTWAYYYFNASTFLEGGTETKDENGKTTVTYSDAEKAAAVEKAKKHAEAVIAGKATTFDEFEALVNVELGNTKEDSKKVEVNEFNNVLYSNLSANEDMIKWLTDSKRETGEMTVIANTTKNDDKTETTNGFYVLYFSGTIDNSKVYVGTVRHLLVKFQGGTKDKETNQMVYTDAEKKAAREKAEKLLAEFKGGDVTDEKAFTDFLTKHTEDVDSNKKPKNDGLYEKITPDSGYVKAFTDWATAEHKAGDMEIVETEYGCHIMYYVEADELNYRDTLIHAALVSENYEKWEEGILKAATVALQKTNMVETDLIISH